MPNPYTLNRQKRKSQGQKVSNTSKKVRIQSGGRRIRIVGGKPIDQATATGTEPIENSQETEKPEKKRPKKK